MKPSKVDKRTVSTIPRFELVDYANHTKVSIQRAIESHWPEIVKRSRVRSEALACLPQAKNIRLLGSSRKVAMGEIKGFYTAVIYLSPASESGRNLCAWATILCALACLGHNSGQLALPASKLSRLWKTALRFGAPRLYFALLKREIRTHEAYALKRELEPVIRLDGSSDLGDSLKVHSTHPRTQFYDYTKSPKRAAARSPVNVDFTLSYSGENLSACLRALKHGGRVAIVVDRIPALKKNGIVVRAAESVPESILGFPAIDADEHDLRFTEPGGTWSVLRFKAQKHRAKHRALAGAFVVDCDSDGRYVSDSAFESQAESMLAAGESPFATEAETAQALRALADSYTGSEVAS